jgi:putative DNA primase/helicase
LKMSGILEGPPLDGSGPQESQKVGQECPIPIVASNAKSIALMYARNGWRIFPLHTPAGDSCSCGGTGCKVGKHPRISNWQNDASCDEATVDAWFTKWPDANIGLLLDGLAVLDIDPRHCGLESLAALEAEYGALLERARQRSGSGGWHYLFLNDNDRIKTARGFRNGLDLLSGSGCYVVAAPSLHVSGGRYEWIDAPHPLSTSRDAIALGFPPHWLLDVANGPKTAAERVPSERLIQDALAKVAVGEGRNNAGLWLFTQLRDNGYSRAEAEQVRRPWVEAVNDATPGQERYALEEARATLASAFKRAPRAPWTQSAAGAGLVQEIEKALKVEHHFARDEGDVLYHFEEGVYKSTGEKFVRRTVKQYCEANGKAKSWTPELAERVVKYLTVDAPELWERPPLDTVNVKNGLLDVKTRELKPHSPDFLSPIQIGARFDTTAKCPAIDQFIEDVFPDDAQHAAFEVAAWLMLPDTSIQKAVLALGEGANGKSVYLNLLEAFIGKPNATALSLHKIESDKFAAARLLGKLANICPDLPTAALSGTSTFKALSGGDSISGEHKFKTSFEFRPYARLVFSANSAPRSDDATHGFFRRWLVIPFNRRFDENDARCVPRAVLDARLTATEELSGLLNRALDALPQIQRGTFKESLSMRAAWTEFRRTTDPLAVFLDGETVDTADGVILKERLRALYAGNCKDNGRPIPAENVFTERLRAIRPNVKTAQRRIDGKPRWCFVGIGLRAAETEQGNMGF